MVWYKYKPPDKNIIEKLVENITDLLVSGDPVFKDFIPHQSESSVQTVMIKLPSRKAN